VSASSFTIASTATSTGRVFWYADTASADTKFITCEAEL
jgi:hypothetical protein